MVKHFPKEHVEALNNLLTKDKRYAEYRNRGVCVHEPEMKCSRDYWCIKMAETYGNHSSKFEYRSRMKNNPFANFTQFFATSDPGFICEDLENKLKEKETTKK